ncbi:MAG: hypothetical protein JOZ33_15890 [Acidobacteriaceae bacterium]|nr:hypothetical protein [Acidobacteriaceae bacterium]
MNPIDRIAAETAEDESTQEDRAEARIELSHGARGALLIAGIAVSLLFIGWMLFYFVLFMRRGYVG